MTCIIKYKGKSYTEAQFKELLLTDKNLAQSVLLATKYRMKSVAHIYEKNPALKSVGSMYQYEKYLESTGRNIKDPVDVEGFKIYRENLKAGKIFNEGDIADINQAIVSKLLSSLNPSEAIHVPTIKREAQRVFFALMKDLKAKGMVEEAAFMMENRDQILGRNGNYENSVFEYLAAEVNVNSLEEFMDLTGENVKEHGQASYEINMLDTLSAKVKLLFASIPDTRVSETFGGLRPLLGSNEALNLLQQILAEINGNELSKILTALKAREAMNEVEAPIYKRMAEILKQVEKTDPDILNQILYNLYQAKVDMKFVMWDMDNKTGYFSLQVFDANVKNPLFIKRNDFTENLKVAGLIDMYEGSYYKLDESVAKSYREDSEGLLSAYETAVMESNFDPYSEEFRKDVAANIDRNILEKTLAKFGIILNNQTYLNLYEGKLQNDVDILNLLLGGDNSIVGQHRQTLDKIEELQEAGTPLSLKTPPRAKKGFKNINPLTYKNSQVLDLIKADNSVQFIPMGSMYIAGKTINMFQQHNPISNKIKDLKSDLQKYIDDLENEEIENPEPTGMMKRFLDAPMTSNSFLINTIQSNPVEALKYLDTFLISLEAIKKSGTSSQDDMGVTDLSDKDSFITLLGMFASSEGVYEDSDFTDKTGIKLRKGLANFGTLSDSSQLPFLKTFLLELGHNEIDIENDTLSESLLQHIKEQLLESDLKRIADFIMKVEGKTTSNVSGYDTGALWISGMASLNSLPVNYTYDKVNDKGETETVNTKRSLIHLFRSEIRGARDFIESQEYENEEQKKIASDNLVADVISAFLTQHQAAIDTDIQNNIIEDVNELVSKNNKGGLMVESNLVDTSGRIKATTGSETSDYFKEDTTAKSARLVAYDYVINTFLQQKEIQTLFAGDLASYFKDKMGKNLSNELPEVTLEDLVDHYYSDDKYLIKYDYIPDLNKFKEGDLSSEKVSELLEKYPQLAFAKEFTSREVDPDKQQEVLLEAAYLGVNRMFKDVQNNLSKRLKGQISPGNQLSKVTELPDYIQIMVDDVEVGSETIENYVKNQYPELYKDEAFIGRLREFKTLDNIYERTQEEEDRWKELYRDGYKDTNGNHVPALVKSIPKIAAYLRTTSTDAQEYTTWKDNLDQLLSQGRLTRSNYEKLKIKLEQQSEDIETKGAVQEQNLLSQAEMELMVMQPSKPLYSGMTTHNVNGHIMERYIYIKSSSFPLVPELTQKFPKLNNLRRNIENLERDSDKNVRVSYQSAVKVGSVKNLVNISALYQNPSPEQLEQIKNSAVILSRKNFYIQQDKPFKSDKNKEKGKQDRTTRATQFEKIILGDGINKITQKVFPANAFDQTLLDDLGIVVENSNINGKDLKKIYDELYKREQKTLAQQLFDELGIDTFADIQNGKPEVMQELVKMANKRLSNKQDRKAMELMYIMEDDSVLTAAELANSDKLPKKAYFKIPLMLTPNSRKLESVFNSIVSKNNTNLTLPGYSFPVASQEGFDFKDYNSQVYAKALKDGLVVTKDFDPQKGLQASRVVDGKLEPAQVFMANKFKYYNKETRKQEYINLKDFLDKDGYLDTSKLPEELLTLFSFRIPTSAHQSGTLIKIVGFLPHTSGDLLIVPKDHTVQIGEDYDIDVRYAYQYNYMMTENGSLKKMDYKDLEALKTDDLPDLTVARENFQRDITELFDKYYEYRDERNDPNRKAKNAKKGKKEEESPAQLKNPILEVNRKTVFDIAVLETYAYKRDKNKEITEDYQDMVNSLLEEGETVEDAIGRLEAFLNTGRKTSKSTSENLKKEYKNQKKYLLNNLNAVENVWKPYQRAKKYKVSELKVLENNIVSVYKSVFASASPEVQNLITSVLSTDFSEDSAKTIDSKNVKTKKNFNIYSPATQRKVMKLGADGKMGIGVHSNAVTLNSILQQLDEPISIYSHVNSDGDYIKYNLKLGLNTFNGDLGVVKTSSGRRSSEFLMESQNSSTDNQKLEIMGRRNENPETISVFSLMQMAGLEEESYIKVDGKMHNISYPSLFISQPIIKEFSEAVKKLTSSTNTSTTYNAANEVSEKLRAKLIVMMGKASPYWAVDQEGTILAGTLSEEAKEELGRMIDAQYLYDQIGTNLKDITEATEAAAAFYVLHSFDTLRGASTQITELQSFINIEGSGLGISYFDTINLKDKVSSLSYLRFKPTEALNKGINVEDKDVPDFFTGMFGEKIIISEKEKNEGVEIPEDAVFIETNFNNNSDLYVIPKNHYSHKIFNTISLGYNLWNSIFPYDNPILASQIDNALAIAGINNGTKRATELKYSVMASMKDYSYTNSRKLFGANLNNTRDQIFFDNKEINQESLASYLVRLRSNPEYKKLFDKPFFNELQLEINSPGYPSVIKYVTNDVTKANNLKVYNTLLNMVDSKEPLPSKKNGQVMNYETLMKELLTYSLLSDQGNGAIGFRHLLPLPLFEKYYVDAVLRNRNDLEGTPLNPKVSYNLSLTYNGSYRAMEDFLGVEVGNDFEPIIKIPLDTHLTPEQIKEYMAIVNATHSYQTGDSEDMFTMLDDYTIAFNHFEKNNTEKSRNFVRQFFQHNADKVKNKLNYDSKGLETLLADNGYTYDDFMYNDIPEFSVSSDVIGHNIKDDSFLVIEDSEGALLLYEKEQSFISADIVDNTGIMSGSKKFVTYKRITTLGAFGFNEYNSSRDVQRSLVEDNMYEETFIDPIFIKRTPVARSIKKQESADKIVEALFTREFIDQDGVAQPFEENMFQYAGTFELIRSWLPNFSNIDIKVVDNLQGKAKFSMNGELGLVEINRNYLNNENTTVQELQSTLLEEFIHYVTVNSINQYIEITGIDSNGRINYKAKTNEEIPAPLIKLMKVYQQAFLHYKNKYGEDRLNHMINSYRQQIGDGEELSLNSDREGTAYRLFDFHEFLAGLLLKDQNFAKELSQVKYLETDKSIIRQIIESLAKLFVRILPKGTRRDSILAHGVESFAEFVEYHNMTTPTKNNLLKRFRVLPGDEVVSKATGVLKKVDKKFQSDSFIVKPEMVAKDPRMTRMFSGNADGVDKFFESVSREYSLPTRHYEVVDLDKALLKSGDKSLEVSQEIEKAYVTAKNDLGRGHLSYDWNEGSKLESNYSGGLVRRDYLQAKSADAVFAVGTFVYPGDVITNKKTGKEYKITSTQVSGGTGYAVQMAINMGKPVFVFDQKLNKWLTFNGTQWAEIDAKAVKLTKRFAGVGTRELEDNGRQAIKDLYKNTFDIKQPKPPVTIVENKEITYSVGKEEFAIDPISGVVTNHKNPTKEVSEKTKGKILLAYFNDNKTLFPTAEYNKNTYAKVFDTMVNTKTGGIVTSSKIEEAFEATKPPIVETFIEPKVPKVEGQIVLNKDQEIAKKDVLEFFNDPDRKSHSLLGYAGTGKTTILNMIVDEYKKKKPFAKISYGSPTHRANSVTKLKNPDAHIKTLHSYLGLKPSEKVDINALTREQLERYIEENEKGFQHMGNDPLKALKGGILIVDESSMISDPIYDLLLEKLDEFDIKVLFIGDSAQLKPVKQNTLGKALSGTEAQSSLTIVERADNNALLKESMFLRENPDFTFETDYKDGKGVNFVKGEEEFLQNAFELFKSEEFKKNPLLVRIGTGTNERASYYNEKIRTALIADLKAKGEGDKVFGDRFFEGQVLMGYSNFKLDKEGQPAIANGGDYYIDRIQDSVLTPPTRTPIEIPGYRVELKNALNPTEKSFTTFILEDTDETYDKMTKLLQEMYYEVQDAYKKSASMGKEKYLQYTRFKESFINTRKESINIATKPSGQYEAIYNTVKDGYAHTVHKSQGGTYKYAFLDATDFGKFKDQDVKQQLRYVGVTRAESATHILAAKDETEVPTKKIKSEGFNNNELPKNYKEVINDDGAEIFVGTPFTEEQANQVFEIIQKEFEKSYPSQQAEDKFGKVRRSLYFSDTPYTYSGTTRAANANPKWLDSLIKKVEDSLGVKSGYFDMSLINEYQNGNQKIGFHTDNEPILNNNNTVNPTVVTVSFGDTRTMVLKSMDNKETKSFEMENGSVAVMGYNSQINYKHGIQQEAKKGLRYSITLRHNAVKAAENNSISKPKPKRKFVNQQKYKPDNNITC